MNIETQSIQSVGVKGAITGYQVVSSAGVILEEKSGLNISNTIVDSGLDVLSQMTALGQFRNATDGSAANTRSGVLHYCGRGTGIGVTTAETTRLVNRVGGYTATMYTDNTGVVWNGTKYNIDADEARGTCTMRISHRHETEEENRIITEVGYFSRAQSNYTMFSRVQFPAPIVVPIGCYLITTYELQVDIPLIAETRFDEFIDGMPASGVARLACMFPLNNETFGANASNVLVGFNATGAALQGVNTAIAGQTRSQSVLTNYMINVSSVATVVNMSALVPSALGMNFPALGSNHATFNATAFNAPTVAPYVAGSHEREIIFVWPDVATATTADINFDYILVNGVGYKFDEPQTKRYSERIELRHVVKWGRSE